MFNLFKKKIYLTIGQIWETKNENPFEGKWRAKIIGVKNGYVEYIAYYKSENKETRDFLKDVTTLTYSHTEKEFRFFHPILVNE